MKYTFNKSILDKVIRQRNGYLVLAIALVFLCILLTFALCEVSLHKRTFLVPPDINRSFWVSESTVSSEYLAEMSLFFMSLRLNLTPSNVKAQRDMLLKYADPKYYGELKMQLVAEGDRIAKEDLSYAFYPVDFKVDAKNLTTKVTGDIKATIGKETLPDKRVNFLLKFNYSYGRLFVTSFKENGSE